MNENSLLCSLKPRRLCRNIHNFLPWLVLGIWVQVCGLTSSDAIEQRENSDRSAQIGRDGWINPVRLL